MRPFLTLLTGVLFTCGPAFAQTATTPLPAAADGSTSKPDKPVLLDAYVVQSGFAGSLAAAAETKMKMDGVTEVIAAEDIGKLPDISIADSLTRLTGVAAQTTNGRSQEISIRGLNGDFTVTTLNGLEQTSTSLNRSVEFDQYPAELLSGVVLYKTATADLVAQGLAGTVDLRTVQPLSTSRRAVATSGYYSWTQYKQHTPGVKGAGDRANFSYVDQFLGGKLGIALGFAHTDTPYVGLQFQGYGYNKDAAGNLALSGEKSYVRGSNLARDGFMAVVEYSPSEAVHSTVNFFVSHFEEKQQLRGIETPLVASFTSTTGTNVLQPGYTVENGLVTKYTVTNVQPVIRSAYDSHTAAPVSIGWDLKLGQKSAWPVAFDAGYSRVRATEMNLETYSGLGFNKKAATGDTWTVQSTPGQIPVITTGLDYTNASQFVLTDPQGYGVGQLPTTGQAGYLKYIGSLDELGQFKLATKHPLPRFFSDLEVGASYTDRFKHAGQDPSGWIFPAGGAPTAPTPASVGVTDLSFLGIKGMYSFDPVALLNSGAYGYQENLNGGIIAQRYNVEEKVSRGYAQFDLDTRLGPVPVTGNLGLQAIRTDQESTGKAASGRISQTSNNLVILDHQDGATYTDFAPSLNLTFKPGQRTFLRFSVARQLARPRMYDMRANQSFSYNASRQGSTDLTQSPWSADAGNPRLKPWKANSVDLSLEHYFHDNMGYVSLAAFNKQLLTYIYQLSVLHDFTGYTYTGTPPLLSQGAATTPQNGAGGSVRGLEFTLSLPSELLSKSIRGFGVVLGGAYTDSSIQPWGPGNGTSPIAGLSRKVANATVYFERGGFSIRVSERYRSAFRAYIANFGVPSPGGDVNANGGFSTEQPTKVFDAQVSYSLKLGGRREVSVYLQGSNLNNEPLITYNNNDPRQVVNYQKYGASYSLGASLKF